MLQGRHVCVLSPQSNSTVVSHSSALADLRSGSQIVCQYLKTSWPEEDSEIYSYQQSFIFVLLISKVLMLTSKSSGKVRQTLRFSVLEFPLFIFNSKMSSFLFPTLLLPTPIPVIISLIYWPAVGWVGFGLVRFGLVWFYLVWFDLLVVWGFLPQSLKVRCPSNSFSQCSIHCDYTHCTSLWQESKKA